MELKKERWAKSYTQSTVNRKRDRLIACLEKRRKMNIHRKGI